jgi:hypothetical protein
MENKIRALVDSAAWDVTVGTGDLNLPRTPTPSALLYLSARLLQVPTPEEIKYFSQCWTTHLDCMLAP